MTLLLTIIAVIIGIAGIVALLRRQILWGVILIVVALLIGPGAISTAIVLQTRAEGVTQHIALCACILGVSAASYVIFRVSAHGAKWLNPIVMKITTRIMGLLLAAVIFMTMRPGFIRLRPPSAQHARSLQQDIRGPAPPTRRICRRR